MPHYEKECRQQLYVAWQWNTVSEEKNTMVQQNAEMTMINWMDVKLKNKPLVQKWDEGREYNGTAHQEQSWNKGQKKELLLSSYTTAT